MKQCSTDHVAGLSTRHRHCPLSSHYLISLSKSESAYPSQRSVSTAFTSYPQALERLPIFSYNPRSRYPGGELLAIFFTCISSAWKYYEGMVEKERHYLFEPSKLIDPSKSVNSQHLPLHDHHAPPREADEAHHATYSKHGSDRLSLSNTRHEERLSFLRSMVEFAAHNEARFSVYRLEDRSEYQNHHGPYRDTISHLSRRPLSYSLSLVPRKLS